MKRLINTMVIAMLLLVSLLIAIPVSAAEPTEISTVEQFMDFMTKSENWAGSYKLTTDIDLTEQEQNPIGNTTTAFTGSFDGDGHTISGINITGTTYTGLFGVVTSDGDQTVIKNFTLKGKIEATSFSGGAVGIILGETLVKDVTISEEFTFSITGAVGRVGGVVGAILNNCALTDVKNFQYKDSFAVTVTGCVNNADISITTAEAVGGIVGRIFPAVAATKTYAGKTVTNVITISDCVNNGNIEASAEVAGIVGTFNTGYIGNTNTVTDCKNYGDITGHKATSTRVAGIVGYAFIQTSVVHFLAEKCYNEGNIQAVTTSTGNSVVGGIVGHLGTGQRTGTVSQCWNAGNVTAAGNMAGGIVGAPYPAVIEDCYNSGTVSAGGTRSGGIFSYTEYAKSSFSRNYTTGEGIGVVLNTVTPTMVANYDATATEFDGLNDNNAWILSANGPELAYFHVHDLDAKYVAVEGGHVTSCYCNDVSTYGTTVIEHTLDEIGVCTAMCGYSECAHKNTTEEITLASTCVATGLKNVTCTLCGEVMTDVEVPENPDNHTNNAVVVTFDAEKGIVYERACCGVALYTQAALTDIYVSAEGIEVTADYAFESAIGGTTETAFKDFELAMQYAAASVASGNEAVTIHIVDNAYVPADYATPEYNGMIIVTGGTLNFDATPRHWFANGDVTFEKLTFKSATSDTSGTEFYAQNHKMVMGEGLKMGNEGTTVPGTGFPGVNKFRAYVFGGYENVADVADGTEMNTDITVRSGEYWFVAGWNRSKNTDTVYPENSGTGKITVGKVNEEDTLFIAYFVGYSVFNQYLNDASKVTITIDGDVGIYKFVPLNHDGSRKVEETDLLETEILLLEDSSINAGDSIPDTIVEDITWYNRNAKVTIYADLRNEATLDEAIHIKAYFDNRAKEGYVCEVSNYMAYCAKYLDGHTYVDGICSECGALEICAHENYKVVATTATCTEGGVSTCMCYSCGTTFEKDGPALGHTWDEGEITTEATPGVAGEKTFTCTVCGETKTEEIPAESILGDVNGDNTITVVDVLMIIKAVLNGDTSLENADMNGDGALSLVDVLRALKNVTK